MKNKLKTYVGMVRVNLDTTVEVKAESFEDALIMLRNFDVTDIVTFDGDHNDSTVEITGVFE